MKRFLLLSNVIQQEGVSKQTNGSGAVSYVVYIGECDKLDELKPLYNDFVNNRIINNTERYNSGITNHNPVICDRYDTMISAYTQNILQITTEKTVPCYDSKWETMIDEFINRVKSINMEV